MKIIIGIAVLITLAAAGTVLVARSGDVTVRGSMSVFDPEDDIIYTRLLESEGDDCTAPPISSLVSTGTSVIVKDDNEKTLGIGELGAGTVKVIDEFHACQFPFKFTVAKPDTDYFTIRVGEEGEGVTFKTDRLAKPIELAGRT